LELSLDGIARSGWTIPLVTFLLGQGVALFLWASHIDGRINENLQRSMENEREITELGKHVEVLDSVGGRQVHRTIARLEAVEKLSERLDVIVRTLPALDERTQLLRSQANDSLVKINELVARYRSDTDGGKTYRLQSVDEKTKTYRLHSLDEKTKTPLPDTRGNGLPPFTPLPSVSQP